MARAMRAKAGIETREIPITTFFRSAPRKATMAMRRTRAGKARKMSTTAMSRSLDAAPEEAGQQPDRAADHHADGEHADRHDERHPPAPDQPGEDVEAVAVGAEQVAGLPMGMGALLGTAKSVMSGSSMGSTGGEERGHR